MANNLYVGNLSFDTTADDLITLLYHGNYRETIPVIRFAVSGT